MPFQKWTTSVPNLHPSAAETKENRNEYSTAVTTASQMIRINFNSNEINDLERQWKIIFKWFFFFKWVSFPSFFSIAESPSLGVLDGASVTIFFKELGFFNGIRVMFASSC